MVFFGLVEPLHPGFTTVLAPQGITVVTRHLFETGTEVTAMLWPEGGRPIPIDGVVRSSRRARDAAGRDPGRMIIDFRSTPPPAYVALVSREAPRPTTALKAREFPRFDVQLLAEYCRDAAPGDVRLAEVVSISDGGCMLLTGARNERAGETVNLRIEMALHPEPVRMRGMAVWTKSPVLGSNGEILEPGRMGIRFEPDEILPMPGRAFTTRAVTPPPAPPPQGTVDDLLIEYLTALSGIDARR